MSEASPLTTLAFLGVFPVNIRNKFVLQQQVTIIFDERRQPQKIFFQNVVPQLSPKSLKISVKEF